MPPASRITHAAAAIAAVALTGCGGRSESSAAQATPTATSTAATATSTPAATTTPRGADQEKPVHYKFVRRPLIAFDKDGISAYVRLNHALPSGYHAVLDIDWGHSQKPLDQFDGNCYGSSVEDDIEFGTYPPPGYPYKVRLHLPHHQFLRARVRGVKPKRPKVIKKPRTTLVEPEAPYLAALGCPPIKEDSLRP